jgi:hypothetical protein
MEWNQLTPGPMTDSYDVNNDSADCIEGQWNNCEHNREIYNSVEAGIIIISSSSSIIIIINKPNLLLLQQ